LDKIREDDETDKIQVMNQEEGVFLGGEPLKNPRHERFCILWASDREFFGNGTQSYIEAYNIDLKKPGAYNSARVGAQDLLLNPAINSRITQIIDATGLSEPYVDKQLYISITQNADMKAKVCFGADLWEVQQNVIEAVRDNQYVSIASCHGIGKSFLSAHVVHWFLNAFPHSIVLTTAPTARQVEDILWKEINVAYERGKERFDIDGKMLNTRYNIGTDWFALGLSTDDPNRFQGYHADYILVIVDESSGIKQDIFEAIEAVSSTGYVRVLELGNPTDPSGHFASTFASKFYKNFTVSCFHTPNFKPFRVFDVEGNLDMDACCDRLLESTFEDRQEAIVRQSLISPHWVYKALHDWGKDSPMFEARCLGRFPKISNDTLIPLQWALDAVDRKFDWDGNLKDTSLGVDVARYGFDKTVFAKMNGQTLQPLRRWPKTSTVNVSGEIAIEHRDNQFMRIRIDDTGVGGGVTDECMAAGIPVTPVNVGETFNDGLTSDEDDKKQYFNKRSKYAWGLRKRFEEGTISIPNDANLISQLTSIKYSFTPKQQIKIESKEDMKKRLSITDSPDDFDAVMLANADANDGHISDAIHDLEPETEEQKRKEYELQQSYRPVTAGFRDRKF
jgi:hypothetical protein